MQIRYSSPGVVTVKLRVMPASGQLNRLLVREYEYDLLLRFPELT
jgi:hypothetical protein